MMITIDQLYKYLNIENSQNKAKMQNTINTGTLNRKLNRSFFVSGGFTPEKLIGVTIHKKRLR